jgi:hypothetical protein
MPEDKKTPAGAPSSDTTSALFVSARRKQLEQQETERREKEKEEQRLAAEAEVQRLEREVEERRRKAEEDARRLEIEAAENRRQAEEDARRIAEEARARQAQAAAAPASQTQPGTALASKPPLNKKLLIMIGGGVVVAIGVVVLLVVLLGGKGDKLVYNPDEATYDYDIFGSYYLGGNYTDIGYFYFDDGTFTLDDAEGTIGIEGTFYVHDDTIMMDTGDRIITMTIIDEYTLSDPEGDIYYLLDTSDEYYDPDIDEDELVYDPDEATYDYNILGGYFLNGDYTEVGYFYYDDGTFMIDDAEGTVGIEGTFYVHDDTIMMDTGDRIITMTIIDEYTLSDPGGDIYLQDTTDEDYDPDAGEDEDPDVDIDYSYLDDAPDGYATFYDPSSGLKLYYPESTQAYSGLTGDDLEIVAVEAPGGYLLVFDLTDAYNGFSGTDDEMLSILIDNVLTEYFDDIYGGFDGVVEGSEENQGSDLSGTGSVALARMNCTVQGGGQKVYVFGELTRVDKQNLIVLDICLRKIEDEATKLLLNGILNSMVYVPAA